MPIFNRFQTRATHVLLSSVLLVSYLAFSAFAFHQPDRYEMYFRKIDNRVVVTQKGQTNELVFDSGTIHGNPNLGVTLNLTPFVEQGSNLFVVEVLNGPSNPHSPWEIDYDLKLNGSVLETLHQANHNWVGDGVVFTQEHTIVGKGSK